MQKYVEQGKVPVGFFIFRNRTFLQNDTNNEKEQIYHRLIISRKRQHQHLDKHHGQIIQSMGVLIKNTYIDGFQVIAKSKQTLKLRKT